MIVWHMIICFAAAGVAEPQENGVPDVLVQAHLQRASFRTASLKYEITHDWPDMASNVRNMEARFFDGDSVYLIDWGDDDGIRERDPQTGSPAFGVRNTCLPDKAILDRAANQWWILSGSYETVRAGGRHERPAFADVRSFGLFAREIQDKTPLEMLDVLRYGEKPHHYRVREHDDGTQTVILTYEPPVKPGPHAEYRWEIDPNRDFAITRVTETLIREDGSRQLRSEVNTDYVRMDGRWWPRKIDSTRPSGWLCSVVFEHAEFDKPDHPTGSAAEILGLPIGCRLMSAQFGEPGHYYYLGGGSVANEEEWKQIKDQYDLAPLEAWRNRQRSMGHGYYPKWWDAPDENLGVDNAAYAPDAWEAYVRRWILKRTATEHHVVSNPLDEKQTTAAWAILKDCRRQAAPICLRIKKELAKVHDVIRSAGAARIAEKALKGEAAKKDIDADVRRYVAAKKREEELEKPRELELIFARLKGRLSVLLTSPQRRGPGLAATHGPTK